MIKTQVQIPDKLFERAKRVAAEKEWSFAEIVRRGLEHMVLRHSNQSAMLQSGWTLPDPVDLGLVNDLFADPEWREEATLSSSASRVIAERLREDAARLDASS